MNSAVKYKTKMYIQKKNFFSTLKLFFDQVSTSGLVGKDLTSQNGDKNGISKLSRHAQLKTLCNMSEIPDGDEPSLQGAVVILCA